MLWFSLALGGDLCPHVRRAPADVPAVVAALEVGADPNASCVWTERVSGLNTFGGVLLAITVPVVGALIAHDQKVDRVRSVKPLQLALARGDQELFDALIEVAELPSNGVDTAVSGAHYAMLAKLIEVGASPSVHTLAGPAAHDVNHLQQVVDAGGKLDAVTMVMAGNHKLSAAWVELALGHGMKTSILQRSLLWNGDSAAFRVLLGGTEDRYDLLYAAVKEKRWDLVEVAAAEGMSLEAPAGKATLLMAAGDSGDVAGVKRLLAAGIDPAAVGPGGATALHHAVGESPALVPLLIGGGVNRANDRGDTALGLSLRTRDTEFAEALLSRGATIDDKTAMAAADDMDVLPFLLSKGLDPNHVSGEGESLVVRAVRRRDEEAFATLAQKGATLDGDTAGTSAVRAALLLYKDQEVWAKRLVAAGARLDRCPDAEEVWTKLRQVEPEFRGWLLANGLPPSHEALLNALARRDVELTRDLIARGVAPRPSTLQRIVSSKRSDPKDAEIVRLLLDAGADPNVVFSFDRTSVHLALKNERDDLLPLLLAAGGDLNRPEFMGKTPLNLAMQEGEDATRAMLALGADPDGVDGDGVTPLSLAVDRDRWTVASILLEAGADPKNCATGFRKTPCLLDALEAGATAVANGLLDAGASVAGRDLHNRTAAELAIHRKDDALLDRLLAADAEVTSGVVHHLVGQCDLKRAAETRARWPAGLNPIKTAARAGCKKEMKPIIQGH